MPRHVPPGRSWAGGMGGMGLPARVRGCGMGGAGCAGCSPSIRTPRGLRRQRGVRMEGLQATIWGGEGASVAGRASLGERPVPYTRHSDPPPVYPTPESRIATIRCRPAIVKASGAGHASQCAPPWPAAPLAPSPLPTLGQQRPADGRCLTCGAAIRGVTYRRPVSPVSPGVTGRDWGVTGGGVGGSKSRCGATCPAGALARALDASRACWVRCLRRARGCCVSRRSPCRHEPQLSGVALPVSS